MTSIKMTSIKMTSMPANLVLRTVYLDPDVDERLRLESVASGVPKGDLFRQYLRSGIKVARSHQTSAHDALASAGREPQVLRTVFVDRKVDERLRVEAFDAGRRWSDQMNHYLRLAISSSVP